MNADLENVLNNVPLMFQLQEKTTPCKVQAKLWEVFQADIFMINNENLLCIVDYYSKISVIKIVESLFAEDLI